MLSVKDSCTENFVTFAEKCHWVCLLKEGILCRVSTLNEVLHQISFLKNLQNIQRDQKDKSGLLNVIEEGTINFESYSFFRRSEVFVGKNTRQQTCCLYVYVTDHRFFARVQIPTSTTYGKLLLESIMAVLTPKLGIFNWKISHRKREKNFFFLNST